MNNVKVNFFLKSRVNHLHQYPIVMTITMNYDRTQIFTGIWIAKNRWNEKTKTVKGKDEETKTLNDTLATLQSHVRQVANELLTSGKPFNPNIIKDRIKNGITRNMGVVESFDLFLKRMENMVPTTYTRATLVKYTNTKERVKEFIKKHTQRNDIYLYELQDEFMEAFELFLRKNYQVSHNTIYKTYQRFTRFLRFEVSRGHLDKYPFPDYKMRMLPKVCHSLTYDEIRRIENLAITDTPRLLQVQQLFILAIYTGIAFIDMEQSKPEDLVLDDSGMLWLRTYRQKTRSRISVPLISNAVKSLEILRSGIFDIPKGKLLPVKNNARMNFEIKQVCELAEINNPELVTWHSARRSTSALLMRMGIPLEILQKILSHKSLGTSLMYYAHVNDDQVSRAMKLLDKRLNESDTSSNELVPQ